MSQEIKKLEFMYKQFQWSFIGIVGFIFLVGCSSEVRQQLQPVPTAFGPRNQLVVIADEDVWKGNVGDSVRYYFSSAYPLLPQPEPIFDLLHYTPNELAGMEQRKQLRTYLILTNLQDEDATTTQLTTDIIGSEKVRSIKEDPNAPRNTVGLDKWAKGQLLIFLHESGEQALADQVAASFPAIKERIDRANRTRIEANVFVNGDNKVVQNDIIDAMRIQMRIPKKYFTALDEDNTIWIRRETPVSSANIMIHKMPYKNQAQLSKENLKAIQDSLGKKLVSSDIEGTYMQINDIDLPLLTNVVELNGNYALEGRGIWEIVNDYMGGAFVSYLTVNPNTNELIFINGFIHAPGEEKREFMQNLEYIISTIKFLS